MHLGHVDRISREAISGWAADPDDLDRPTDVVVIVDGIKIARVRCDSLREDLLARGIYGNGRHGFQHKFSPPLPLSRDAKVAVRFADTGQPVPNGDILLPGGGTEPRIIPAPAPAPIVPAPTTPRTLFRLLRLLEARQGLYPLLYRVDFSGVRQALLHYSVFGEVDSPRPPTDEWTGPLARDYFNELLLSKKFRDNILEHALRAFPEKRRLFFIHIPKCAGSDLASHLALRYPSVKQQWQEEAWFSQEEFFVSLSQFAREVQFSDFILTGGHVRLSYFVDADLIRPIDRIFTVLRDPVDIAISSVNYVITRIHANIETRQMDADVRDWLSTLGISDFPAQISPQLTADLIRRALYNHVIVPPNSMCYWLGGGDAKAVISRLGRYNVELTTTAKYDNWVRSEWGVTVPTKTNVSTKYITLNNLANQELSYLRNLSPEDYKLFNLVENRLSISDRTSVTGEELL